MTEEITYEYCKTTDTFNIYTNTPIGIKTKPNNKIKIKYNPNKKIHQIQLTNVSQYNIDFIHDILTEISINSEDNMLYLDIVTYNQGMYLLKFDLT